jgi:hypothetical protein
MASAAAPANSKRSLSQASSSQREYPDSAPERIKYPRLDSIPEESKNLLINMVDPSIPIRLGTPYQTLTQRAINGKW